MQLSAETKESAPPPLVLEHDVETARPSKLANGHNTGPEPILQVAFGFMGSQTLFAAVELGVFTEIAKGPADANVLAGRLGLHARSARDFFDSLVALKLLDRVNGMYVNSSVASEFLDQAKPSYLGAWFEMANERLYKSWGSLSSALRTGEPPARPNEAFDTPYSDPERLEAFLKAMTGISLASARMLAQQFPFAEYRTVLDVGCAEGAVPVQIALRHKHMKAYGYDLPAVQPAFQRYVHAQGVADRVHFREGDFFKDAVLPHADVVIMGHVLHDWNLEQKRMLLAKAYAALPAGGALIVYESLIDDERRENTCGLLMSLNMLIETPGGFDFTGRDCMGWMRDTGFRNVRTEPLAGGKGMVIGLK